MAFLEVLFLACGLSMDAFAVSVCKGLSVKKAGFRESVLCGLWFGGFQALMPAAGFCLGSLFAGVIAAFDHWVAFGLLAVIGIGMLWESFHQDQEAQRSSGDFSFRTMFVMAVATSIDAMAAGVSLAMTGGIRIEAAALLIGSITFLMSAAGVKLGCMFGSFLEKKAQTAGGIILILLAVKILLEHLGILK